MKFGKSNKSGRVLYLKGSSLCYVYIDDSDHMDYDKSGDKLAY